MESSRPDLAEIVRRLELLEAENAALRKLLSIPDESTFAERAEDDERLAPTFSALRVADGQGVTRARLAMGAHGCALTFFGADEEPRAHLRETNGFGQLLVHGRNVESRIDVRFSEEDHANLVL